tara:strand:- start:159 stop:350 length:192 start_codon:yes stop_codon:yes gene_type:complete
MTLKEYLTTKQMSVAEGARKFGAEYQTFHHWVRQERIPRLKDMRRLALWTNGNVGPQDFYDDE